MTSAGSLTSTCRPVGVPSRPEFWENRPVAWIPAQIKFDARPTPVEQLYRRMRIKGNISALAGLLLLGVGVAADDPVKVPYCGAHNVTSHDLYDLSSLIRQKG